jgi:hypothetical protein
VSGGRALDRAASVASMANAGSVALVKLAVSIRPAARQLVPDHAVGADSLVANEASAHS